MYMAYGWPQVIPLEQGPCPSSQQIIYLKVINRLLLVVSPYHLELWSSSQVHSVCVCVCVMLCYMQVCKLWVFWVIWVFLCIGYVEMLVIWDVFLCLWIGVFWNWQFDVGVFTFLCLERWVFVNVCYCACFNFEYGGFGANYWQGWPFFIVFLFVIAVMQHKVRLGKYMRDSDSLQREGENLQAVWSPDGKLIAILVSVSIGFAWNRLFVLSMYFICNEKFVIQSYICISLLTFT